MKPVTIFVILFFSLSIVSAETYFYANNQAIAVKEGSSIQYLYSDRLGTEINTKTMPFGQTINKGKRFGFTGKEEDISRLHNFNARYYDSNTGRFTSTDPVPNQPTYQYVANNPLNLLDPTGTIIEFVGTNEDLNTVQSHFNSLLGENVAQFQERDGRFFLEMTGQESEFEHSFALVNELVTEDNTIIIRLGGVESGIEENLFVLNEENNLFELKQTRTHGARNQFVLDEAEYITHRGRLKTTKRTISGCSEICYENEEKTIKNTDFVPFITLAHEMGHGLAYYSGEEQYDDIPGTLQDDDPHSLGPAVYWENLVREEHGFELRTWY